MKRQPTQEYQHLNNMLPCLTPHCICRERVFERICDEYAEWVVRTGKQLPPEWNMPDLVRTVIGDEAIHMPGFLKELYYDVMLDGPNSWLCKDVFKFLDLINYVF